MSFKARYHFALATEEQICDALSDIRKSALVSNDDDADYAYDELAIAHEIIQQIESAIYNDRRLISPQVLGALAALAMDSPHRDIKDREDGAPHDKSPEQELSLTALRSLGSLHFFMRWDDPSIINHLKAIAMSSMDRDIRLEAVNQLYVNAPTGWNVTALAVAALHRIGSHNDDLYTRIAARNKLIVLEQGKKFTGNPAKSAKLKP